jgi:hypothetical protein
MHRRSLPATPRGREAGCEGAWKGDRTMKMKVTYKDCNGAERTITLHDAQWQTIRGTRVLRGQQLIRGKMVNRSIAANEIVPNGIRSQISNPVIR